MIKPIKLTIDACEVYDIDDNEISVCLNLPYPREFKKHAFDIPRNHWSRNVIRNKFLNEGNFYKYLIKVLIK